MKKRRAPPRILWLAVTSILIAPLLVADEKPEAPRGQYRADPGVVFEEPGEAGWGKGTVLMPTFEDLGLMVGVLCENKGEAIYSLDAMLTGCIPSQAEEGGPQFWFGGLYGAIQEYGSGTPLARQEERGLAVEGTWWLLKGNRGRFSAEIKAWNEAGNEYVCGVIEGKFDLAQPHEKQPIQGPAALGAAIGPDTKAGLHKHSPYRGVEADDCICPVAPFSPARPAKAAGEGEDPWGAEGGVGKYQLVITDPMPYPGSPDFEGALGPPEPPELAGLFALRYVLFE
jgi:hypothetical protein